MAGVAPIKLNLPPKANILIDQAGHARLADFGLLTIISDPRYLLSSSSHSQGGTIRWMSPERIAPEQFGFKNSRPTISSDCYALGMVIYETISGNFPFHKDRDVSVYMKVMQGQRPSRGARFTRSLWEMLERCWASAPNNRPSVEDVRRCVEMMSNLPEPLSPGADEGVDEDGDDWDTATSSSGGDSLDFYATDDHIQLPPTHSLHDHHLTDSHRTPSPCGRMSSPVYPAAEDPSLSRSGNKRPYTPDSPPPTIDQNKRPRVTLNSSATDDRVQLPPIHNTRPISNPETGHHPASEPGEQVNSWASPRYTQSNSLTNAPSPISSPPTPTGSMAERPKGRRGKLPKPVTDYLKDWLHRHSDRPYPSEDEKKQLCAATGLRMSEVANWMINVCQFLLSSCSYQSFYLSP